MTVFWIYVVASFVTGGLFIALQSLSAEHTRGIVRGILLTIPSTMAVGLFFIGLTKSPLDVSHTALVLPAIMSLSFLFATTFALTSRLHAATSIVLSLGAWALSGTILFHYPPQSFAYSVILSLAIFLGCALIMRLITNKRTFTASPFTVQQILLRSLFAGSIVALTVILARFSGNVLGGLFAGFPAVFSSTFIMYRYLHGGEVIPAVVYTTLMPGYGGMLSFVAIMYYAAVPFGIVGALIVAYLGTFTFNSIYYVVHKRVLSFL